MVKDKRTSVQRKAEFNRKWKRFLREKESAKMKNVRKENSKNTKRAEQLAYAQHMSRLQQELGI